MSVDIAASQQAVQPPVILTGSFKKYFKF